MRLVKVLLLSSNQGAVAGVTGNKETGNWCHGHSRPSRSDNIPPEPNPPFDHSVEEKDNTTPGVYNLIPPHCLHCLWGG